MLFILKMKSIVSPIPSNLPPLFPKSFPSLSSSFSSSSSLLFRTPKTLISPKSAYILPPKRPFCSPIFSSMETTRSSCGEVHVIVGPMFAGKTTALLRRVQSERDNGRNVAIIKSDKDTRYGLDFVVTHDGVKLPCWALPDLTSIRQKLGKDAYEKIDVIGIDEAQFFDDLHDFCSKAADYDGKTVIVAGLDGDYLRRRFGSVLDVIPLADSVTKLTARCELCGKRAFFTLRKTTDTKTELIGGADVYMPVCRQHYVNGQVVIEAARTVLESKNVQCDSCIEATP